MATKLSAKSLITAANTADADYILWTDASTGTSHRILKTELHAALVSDFFANQAQAEAGVLHTRIMTPLRVEQLLATKNYGAMQFLATADAASDATIDFTAFDATKYDFYEFILSNIVPATDAQSFMMRTRTDGGTSFDSGASAYAYMAAEYTDAAAVNARGNSGFSAIILAATVGSAAGEDGWSGTVRIYGPHLVEKTQVSFHGSWINQLGTHFANSGNGVRKSSEGVDAVQFLFASGNVESGTITMYGGKNA